MCQLSFFLGEMKNVENQGYNNCWKSFMNIANYHGMPYMCDDDWNEAHVDGKSNQPCCVHG